MTELRVLCRQRSVCPCMCTRVGLDVVKEFQFALHSHSHQYLSPALIIPDTVKVNQFPLAHYRMIIDRKIKGHVECIGKKNN